MDCEAVNGDRPVQYRAVLSRYVGQFCFVHINLRDSWNKVVSTAEYLQAYLWELITKEN